MIINPGPPPIHLTSAERAEIIEIIAPEIGFANGLLEDVAADDVRPAHLHQRLSILKSIRDKIARGMAEVQP